MNIYYGKVDFDLADHKPITGLFEAKIKVIDQTLKEKVIEKLTQKFLEQGNESESVRKAKFIDYLEKSRQDSSGGDFNITHIPADKAPSFKLSSQRRKSEKANQGSRSAFTKESDIDQLDLLDQPENFLNLEDFDINKINEFQR